MWTRPSSTLSTAGITRWSFEVSSELSASGPIYDAEPSVSLHRAEMIKMDEFLSLSRASVGSIRQTSGLCAFSGPSILRRSNFMSAKLAVRYQTALNFSDTATEITAISAKTADMGNLPMSEAMSLSDSESHDTHEPHVSSMSFLLRV